MKTGFLHKKNSFLLLSITSLLLGLLYGMASASIARADGCFVAPPFVWDKHRDINEPTQKAILLYDSGQEDMILQVKYDGPVDQFGWLVPVPSKPSVQPGSMESFYALSRYTQEHWEPSTPTTRGEAMDNASALGSAGGPPPEPVKVVEIKTVGAYEVAVLSATEPGSLENWLTANQFSFPKEKADVIDEYVSNHWYFVAIKIDLRKAGGFKLDTSPRPHGPNPPPQPCLGETGRRRTPTAATQLRHPAMRVPVENFLRQRHPIGGTGLCHLARPPRGAANV